MSAVGTPVDETLKDKLVTGTGAARRIFSTGRKYRDINEKEKKLNLHVKATVTIEVISTCLCFILYSS